MTHEIPLFYFGTTAVFVDDDSDFLNNLSLQLDSRLAFRLFHSPFTALMTLNGTPTEARPVQSYFSRYRDHQDVQSCHIIELSLKAIHREIYNDKRFDQISVVVVDFNMPEVDGLDFCRRIKDPSIKKILLTGKADERIAVQAFNEGIIDRFIRKQEPDAMETLNRAINEMQQMYFADLQRMLFDALSIGPPRFLQDKAFAERFQQIRDELEIVEYYYICSPDGMLMLTATGTPYLLLVQNEDSVRSTYEIAIAEAAPEEVLAALSSDHFVPYFWKTEGRYSSIYQNWEEYLYPAQEFRGNECYLYSVLKNPPSFNGKYLFSYNDYLDRLDENISSSSCNTFGRNGLSRIPRRL